MKRPSVLRPPCAMFGALWVVACSGSNPTLPSGIVPDDAGPSERGILHEPDAPASEASTWDGTPGDGRSNLDGRDAPLGGDALALDSGPPAKVIVTILGPAATAGLDGGSVDGGSVDGGASIPVISKSDRLAPNVQVEVQSQGGDPTLDIIASVKATLIQAGAKSGVSIALNQSQYSTLPGSNSKIYIFADTPFDISNAVGDFYDLQVLATTTGGASGAAVQRIYIDAGPKITFLQPNDGVYVKGSIVVTAMVVDASSPLSNVAFSVGQTPIDPQRVLNSGVQYSTVIDFGSYNPPLDGAQVVTVTATNANGNVSVATRKFNVDNDGPTISATKPANGGLIGKIITIEAKVEDPAGVMASSVVAVVAHGDKLFEVKLPLGADGLYRNIFDTTKLPSYAIYPSISFRAQDVLGNESSVGYLLALDNTPPILDLDPPTQVRLVKKDGTCSWPFDPVGPDAIDDGSVVTQLFDIRARIEDEGNAPLTGSADVIPISTVDPTTVKVLLLDDTSRPLLVDTSDPPDGTCDDINPDLVPSVSPQSSKEAQLVDMAPLAANAGAGDFTPEPGVLCSGKDGSPPPPLCATASSTAKHDYMSYSLGYAGSLPSIWTIPPIIADGLRCAGNQFDASNNLKDGWACVAVEAADKMGNKQVSRPLRICVIATKGSTACSPASLGVVALGSVSFPSTPTGKVVVTTKAPLVGMGGAAVKAGDSIVLSNIVSSPFWQLNGTQYVVPEGATGTVFDVTTPIVPYRLWTDNLDGTAAKYLGTVGAAAQDGADVQINTDQPGTSLPADFAGAVIVRLDNSPPQVSDRRWSVQNITTAGFSLASSATTLGGSAVAPPGCTGTIVKSTSGSTVDASKPCKPWRSFPAQELVPL